MFNRSASRPMTPPTKALSRSKFPTRPRRRTREVASRCRSKHPCQCITVKRMVPGLPSLQCSNAVLHDGMQGIARVAVDDTRALLVVTFLRPIALPGQSYLFDAGSYSLNGGQRLFPRVIKAGPPPTSSPPQP